MRCTVVISGLNCHFFSFAFSFPDKLSNDLLDFNSHLRNKMVEKITSDDRILLLILVFNICIRS